MFNSTTLEVAIGMAFIYLLLSLFCTAINEAFAGLLGTRAKNLEKGIRSLFTDGLKTVADSKSGTAAVTLTDAIYSHGLVQGLYRSTVAEGARKWYIRLGSNLPSYIPSRVFASALFDILFPDIQQEGVAKSTGDASASDQRPTETADTAPALAFMLSTLEKLPPSKGKEAIVTLVKQAGGDVTGVRRSFESWYDDGMDRAAGWYKRRTQTKLFVIGIAIAVVLNVDSIVIGKTLWISPATRSYAITAAEKYAEATTEQSVQERPKSGLGASARNDLSMFQSLSLPIGWNSAKYPWREEHRKEDGTYWQSFSFFQLASTLVGWFLTAMAMTLGAPFWFDLLNQFMVVRSTVKPREKSEVESSKDASS